MKHINITNWQGNITDWTKFNYVYGGLDDTIADRVNLSIKGTNLRNYIKKSDNLLDYREIKNSSFTDLGNNSFKIDWRGAVSTITLPYNSFKANTQYSFTLTSESGKKWWAYNLYFNYTDGTNERFTNNQGVDYGTHSYTSTSNKTLSSITWVINFEANFKDLMLNEGQPKSYEPYGSTVLVENVGKVDLGSLTWSKQTDGAAPYFRASLTDVASSTLNVSCPKFKTVAWSTLYNSTIDKCCAIYYSQYILIRDNSYETAEAFKAAMNGVYLTYDLATPKVTAFGSVDLGSLTYTYQEATNLFYSYPRDSSIMLPKAGGLQSNPMGYVTLSPWAVTTDKVIYPHTSSDYFAVGLRDNTYQNNADGLKNALKGKVMIYELASSNANRLGMVKPSDSAPTAIEDSMSLDELLEPANEER